MSKPCWIAALSVASEFLVLAGRFTTDWAFYSRPQRRAERAVADFREFLLLSGPALMLSEGE